MSASLRRVVRLAAAFSIAGFKAKDQRSVLGFLWSLLNPLLLSVMLFAVFRESLGRGQTGADYFLYVFAGAVVWNFFVMATTVGSASLLVRAELLRNVAFPAEVPVYGDLGALTLQYLVELVALFAAALLLGARPSWTLALLPLVVLGQLAFACGIALVLACFCVVARDLQHVWAMVTRALFFATPVFYSADLAPPALRRWFVWNPVGGAMEATRALCRGGMPAPSDLVVPLAAGLSTLLAGWLVFRAAAPAIIEKA